MSLLATALLGPWDELGIEVAVAVAAVAAVVAISVRVRARTLRRRHRAPGEATGTRPGGAGAAMVSRRTVVERGALGFFAAALTGVVTASIDYVVRTDSRRGRTFDVASPDAVRRLVRDSGRPYYEAAGGFYLVPYPAADLPEARARYGAAVLDGMETGFVALDQTCTHLGCRVKWCPSSQWFECPCHGSLYNAVGEQRRGPAPRGLDRYRVTLAEGRLTVDTATRYLGPPPGTDTTGQDPAGPHCF